MNIITWLGANYDAVLVLLSGLIGLAEVVVRLWFPGELGAVERFGALITEFMNLLKVPNYVKLPDGSKANINSPTYQAPEPAEAAPTEPPKAA